MKEVRGLLVIHLPSNIFHHTSSDCTGGRKGDAVRYCQSEQVEITSEDDG